MSCKISTKAPRFHSLKSKNRGTSRLPMTGVIKLPIWGDQTWCKCLGWFWGISSLKKHTALFWVGNIQWLFGISANFLFANHSFDFFFRTEKVREPRLQLPGQHSDWTGRQVMHQIQLLTLITMEIRWRKMPHVEIRWISPLGLERRDPLPTERGVMVDVVIFHRKKGKLPEKRDFFGFLFESDVWKKHHFSMKYWRIQDWYIICEMYQLLAFYANVFLKDAMMSQSVAMLKNRQLSSWLGVKMLSCTIYADHIIHWEKASCITGFLQLHSHCNAILAVFHH